MEKSRLKETMIAFGGGRVEDESEGLEKGGSPAGCVGVLDERREGIERFERMGSEVEGEVTGLGEGEEGIDSGGFDGLKMGEREAVRDAKSNERKTSAEGEGGRREEVELTIAASDV